MYTPNKYFKREFSELELECKNVLERNSRKTQNENGAQYTINVFSCCQQNCCRKPLEKSRIYSGQNKAVNYNSIFMESSKCSNKSK